MFLQKFKRYLITAGVISFLLTPAFADEAIKYDLGLTAGATSWKGEIAGGGSQRKNGLSGGLVARVSKPVGDSGNFIGLHAGLFKEKPSFKYQAGTGKVNWSGDLLVRAGHHMKDGISPYLAGGVSFAKGEIKVLNFKDNNTHMGWKVAGGVDFPVSKDFVSFVQAEYARYSKEGYSIAGTNLKTGLSSRGVKVGIMRRF